MFNLLVEVGGFVSNINNEKAILVSIAERSSDLAECEISLDELERLLNTAGGTAVLRVIQVKESFNVRTCIGSGKVKEISDACKSEDIKLVIFDFELSPMQIRNLENDIGDVTVIDRSMLILDIFALHATSADGKLQVELAQLKYSAPRLTGKGIELSRQGGGIGSRGPGESKLETDRRHLREKINNLEARLRELEHTRLVMRSQRDRSGLAKIAIVGYTNAGKSTLLNALTGANVLSEDKLFATLDPTTRKCELPSGESVLFTDTVGFVRKLPHHLIKAFKSTLDEVLYADLLLIVSDVTDAEVPKHLKVTEEVIADLGASEKPRLYVYNKCDEFEETLFPTEKDSVFISARTGEGIAELLNAIENKLAEFKKEYKILIPYEKQSLVSAIYKDYSIKSTEYTEDGTLIVAVLDEKGKAIYQKYIREI